MSQKSPITDDSMYSGALVPVFVGLIVLVSAVFLSLVVATGALEAWLLASVGVFIFVAIALVLPSKRVEMQAREALRDTDVLYRYPNGTISKSEPDESESSS